MSRGRYAFLVLASVVASFAGGALSGNILPVAAQPAQRPQKMTAQSFVVVDEDGKRRAELGITREGEGALRVFDAHGKLVWSTDTRIMPVDRP